MAALIGLFVGAFVGHMLWRDWGAALGGVAGFIIGAKLAALRRTTAARSTTSSPIPAPPPPPTLPEAVDREHALLSRIAELERRVAHLEQARAGAVGTEPFVAPRSAAEPFVAPRSAAEPFIAPQSAAEPFIAPQSAAEAAPLASTTTPPTLAATTDSPMASAAPVIEREPARARASNHRRCAHRRPCPGPTPSGHGLPAATR